MSRSTLAYRPAVYDRPLWRTAWRRLRRRPLQYLLFVLGVALGVAMMVSIDLASGSANRAFELSTSAVTGRATHRITGTGSTAGLDDDVYRELRLLPEAFPAAPVVEGYVLAEALGAQPLRLVGVDLFAEPPFRSYLGGDAGLQGMEPFLVQPNTVILSAPLAERYGLALGDVITLDVATREVAMQIVGLLEPADAANERALASLLFTDIANAQELFEMRGRLSHIDLIIEDEAVLDELAAWLPAGITLEEASARSNAVQQMTAAFQLNLQALSLLALVVGMFLIYNTVSFSVVQRRPLFGILRSLGVTGRQLFRLILVEAAGLSLLGSLLGLVLGVLLGRIMVRLVTQTINDIYFVVNVQDVAVPLGSLVKGVVIGVAAALVASFLPAWEALRTTPVNTLRRSMLESKARRLLPWLFVGWAVLVGLGALLLWLRLGLAVAFAGLFAVLFGFALLTPPLTAWLMRRLAGPLHRLLGILGRMAPRDIDRSLSRTSVAIAALMVAVSVIVGVSVMISSFRLTVSQWLSDSLQADVYASPPSLTASQNTGTLPADVVETLLTWPGVDLAVTARRIGASSPQLETPVELVAVSGDVSAGGRRYAWLGMELEEAWRQVLDGEAVMISEPLLLKAGWTTPPPEPLVLQSPAGEQSFPIVGVYYDYSSDQGTINIGRATYERYWQDEGVTTVGLFVASGRTADEIAAEIQAAFSNRPEVVITSNEGVLADALEIFDRTFAITAALRLLAVVVAFIGVLSALMSLQLERARELGVLRATGMTLGQLWRLTLLETGLMGSTAGLLAMPTGYVLAWILIYVINVRSFGWTLQMQLNAGDFLTAFAVALVAALLAGIYPARRLGQMAVATALRQE